MLEVSEPRSVSPAAGMRSLQRVVLAVARYRQRTRVRSRCKKYGNQAFQYLANGLYKRV